MLWFFAGIKRPVILELQGQSSRLFLEASGRVTDISAKVPPSLLDDRSTVYLFDPGAAALGENLALDSLFTVNCSSPNRAHFKEFLKRVQQRRFMPPWALEDLRRIRRFIAPAMEENDLEARYDVVDGSLDTLFGVASVEELQFQMNGAMALYGKMARHALQFPLSDPTLNKVDFNIVPNDLCSIDSSPPFTKARIVFGSPYVLRSLDKTLAIDYQNSLSQQIIQNLDSPTTSVRAGTDFELWAVKVLSFGGTFRCHFYDEFGTPFSNGVEVKFPLLASASNFHALGTIENLHENELFRPISKREFGIDGFFITSSGGAFVLKLLQMTIGSQKGRLLDFLKSDGLHALLHILEKAFPLLSREVEFLYVVPRKGTEVHLSLSNEPFKSPVKSKNVDKSSQIMDKETTTNNVTEPVKFRLENSTFFVKPVAVVLDLSQVYLPIG